MLKDNYSSLLCSLINNKKVEHIKNHGKYRLGEKTNGKVPTTPPSSYIMFWLNGDSLVKLHIHRDNHDFLTVLAIHFGKIYEVNDPKG